ncbi:MAG: anthranilate phosphoribosyltransferase [Firmicutes bacterium]|nr:anthranilate phosphoribosyltransferase [Alicyclobacillaceae bacterium]MCL6496418.1 anthranilate phosphoribosyltransferase [Bacillota bacterium]
MLERLGRGQPLSEVEAEALMDAIMEGQASPIQVAGLLMALRARGETVDELVGFARAMRRHARQVPVRKRPLLDTAGTGGDGSLSFNVSTAAALIAAGAGIRVAKHGNRAASSQSGSADLLEALGVPLDVDPVRVAEAIDTIGFGFVFAQAVHPSMRYAAPARRELGVRTAFNWLGPLTNPVRPEFQLVGVADPAWVQPMAEVLARLGAERAVVVHGAGGLDEVSLAGPTWFGLVERGAVRFGEWTPEAFGLPEVPVEALKGGDPRHNAALCREILHGLSGPVRAAVLANAAAALWAAGAVADVREGVAQAAQSIDRGAAAAVLEGLMHWAKTARAAEA